MVIVVGLGLRISLPLSSQDMLKSANTCLTLETTIWGVTTFRWIPMRKSINKTMQLNVKNKWLINDWKKVTWDVIGSKSHWKAPIVVHKELIIKIILHFLVCGWRQAITSVRRLSKAFKSSDKTIIVYNKFFISNHIIY